MGLRKDYICLVVALRGTGLTNQPLYFPYVWGRPHKSHNRGFQTPHPSLLSIVG